jgi:hypothetical protein
MNRCFYLFSLALTLSAGAVWSAEDKSPAKDLSATYYVQLVLGTNQDKPPDAKYKAVGPTLSKQLSGVFQWKSYWEANRKDVGVKSGKASRVRLSKDCEVEIEFITSSTSATTTTNREIRLFRKGTLVCKSKREIGSKKMSILGGDATDGSSWFVVVRRDEPQYQ